MNTAVILGGGIAGLLAGAAAAHHMDSVVIVERDELSTGPGHRAGVPQAGHVHALLAAGQRDIDYLVPGFLATLVGHGATMYDFASDVVLRNTFGWGVRFPSGIPALGASRALVEWAIRSHVLDLANVTVLQRHSCIGLVAAADSIAAVRVSEAGVRAGTELAADLVIDATGRGSRADRWLAELGYPQPAVDIIDSGVGYTSRIYRKPSGHHPDWQACYIQLGLDERARGATVMPVEGDRWLITLLSQRSDHPARTEHEFLRFARSLSSPVVAETIVASEPLTPITASRSTSSRRARFSHNQPRNLVRLGDAACSFNPLYAQGMSAAARSAVLLEQILRHHDPARMALAFQRRLALLTLSPWLVATSADARRPGVSSNIPLYLQRALGRHIDRVQLAGTVDPHVQHRFIEVFNMLRSPPSLVTPALVARTARQRPPQEPVPPEPPEPIGAPKGTERAATRPVAGLSALPREDLP
ncbi:FAD-dependent oxidoreductase [Nocardia ninae]|uniref:FAD-binding domain-containing protein n=1 Tax=Nocardia ninae NBRC 108245 TaxID=1210091 RepID=A0A511MHA8_9NOCA|nr:FAD-dependent oxidoreductase [Nocardia ninae]GEM39959.1 hypothetical protein NN4_44780 [Nocardia ninae NBRC 108245]